MAHAGKIRWLTRSRHPNDVFKCVNGTHKKPLDKEVLAQENLPVYKHSASPWFVTARGHCLPMLSLYPPSGPATIACAREQEHTSGPRLLDRVRDRIRYKHYSIRTERAYLEWIRRFIRYHDRRHPSEMGAAEVEAFLTHLAVAGRVAASTQNQAKSALLFLYREVLETELPWLDGIEGAKIPQRIPIVLSRGEIDRLRSKVSGVTGLVVRLLYGTGMRLMEGVRLRIKDIDFERLEITVREGKGGKDRVTVLPAMISDRLSAHLGWVKALHLDDLESDYGDVYLPFALARKYPNASREWCWQYAFPAPDLSVDPRSGVTRRHHLGEQVIQRAVRKAALDAGLSKPVSPHTLPFLRNPSARGRLRYPHGTGAPRSHGRQDDHDLHPRAEQRRPRRAEPTRPAPSYDHGSPLAELRSPG